VTGIAHRLTYTCAGPRCARVSGDKPKKKSAPTKKKAEGEKPKKKAAPKKAATPKKKAAAPKVKKTSECCAPLMKVHSCSCPAQLG